MAQQPTQFGSAEMAAAAGHFSEAVSKCGNRGSQNLGHIGQECITMGNRSTKIWM